MMPNSVVRSGAISTAIRIFIFLATTISSSPTLLLASAINTIDNNPYNALIWNAANHRSGNGEIDRNDWFEWWYFKVIVPDTDDAFFFTYGVVNPWDIRQTRQSSRAFVDFGSFANGEIVNSVHAPRAFSAAYDRARVTIANNQMTDRNLVGELATIDGDTVSWDLRIISNWSFNAMGWTLQRWNLANIAWYPIQANARMSGTIHYRGKTITLDNAPAYQDRNWGRSFPKWWAWIVCNDFDDAPGTTLAVGGGEPTLVDRVNVSGLAVGLQHQGREYVFRTVDRHPSQTDIAMGRWDVTFTNDENEKIEISAHATPDKFMRLDFMSPQGIFFHDYEALRGSVDVRLFRRATRISEWKLFAKLTATDTAGIEYGTWEQNIYLKAQQ